MWSENSYPDILRFFGAIPLGSTATCPRVCWSTLCGRLSPRSVIKPMTWKKNEEQPEPREGAKFEPDHPEAALTRSELHEISQQRDIKLHDRGPTNHTSNPSG